MRIVFSRKGFDSQYGRVASPILPDGRMVSIPIPSERDPHRLGQLNVHGIDLAQVVEQLTGGRIHGGTAIHLDPDIDADLTPRTPGWRPSFGQIAAAQSHLNNWGIGPGDLFLFFGWFRRVESIHGRWRFSPASPDIHALFGWLQVADCISIGRDADDAVARRPWLAGHPHVVGARRYASDNNTLYIASDDLVLAGRPTGLPGAGVFGEFRNERRLTAPDARGRSTWRLPAWFLPQDGRPSLTYHRSPSRWQRQGDSVRLQTVGKGQEFVLDAWQYPEATSWLQALFRAPNGSPGSFDTSPAMSQA